MHIVAKTCTGCKDLYPIEDFVIIRNKITHRCKTCKQTYLDKWRIENKDKVDKQRTTWRENNNSQFKQTTRKWYLNNREEEAKKRTQWRIDNPDYHKNWKLENDEKVREYTRKRRMLKNSVDRESYRDLDIYERDSWVCGLCNKPVDKNLIGSQDYMKPSIDHIKPISKGGTDVIANVQLTHLRCNLKKGSLYVR